MYSVPSICFHFIVLQAREIALREEWEWEVFLTLLAQWWPEKEEEEKENEKRKKDKTR
jgi:hypothetical protein